MQPEIRNLLVSVDKPFRYVGGEVGSCEKAWEAADVRFCLVFPDTYEIGMSHVGLSILYDVINSQQGLLAERAFAPWQDMEAGLRASNMPLFSLEGHRPLRDFDVIGVSLAYELTSTNVLCVLDLAGVPLRASKRTDKDPLVIAGGPCAFNPMPMAPFFDAIVIGDGEEVVVEIAEAIKTAGGEKRDREQILFALSKIKGVYVPSVHNSSTCVGMARVVDIDAAPYPLRPMAAYAATQERCAVEVSRGCTRGCRFCQAGFVYRPQRQRGAERAARLACDAIAHTGKDEFSFLALSIGDWQGLEPALSSVQRESRLSVNATLPSLRVESLTASVISAMGTARSGSFTLAPEAATERMRAFINKGNTDEDLFASVEKVFAAGFSAVKLYFMLGLPGETDAEIEGIERLARKCLSIGRRLHKRPTITVSTSTFVPKAHTPLQRERQISIEETEILQRRLKKILRGPGIEYRWHSAEMSFLEGVFSRGGAELADAIEIAYKKGARFDGWDECMDFNLWMEAFAEAGIDADSYLAARAEGFEFPWDCLGVGPSREFLAMERTRAFEHQGTPDCSTGKCSACGICDAKKGLINRIASVSPELVRPVGDVSGLQDDKPVAVFKYRVRFSKTGCAAFLGHLEALDALRRGFRASGLPLVYSQGFNPRARIAAGPALSVGIESSAEFADVELCAEVAPDEIVTRMKDRLPQGMEVLDVGPIDGRTPALAEAIAETRYEIDACGLAKGWEKGLERFASDKGLMFTRERKGKKEEVDLKLYVGELAVSEKSVLGILVSDRRPALKISEILQGLFGVTEGEARRLKIRKTETVFRCPTNLS